MKIAVIGGAGRMGQWLVNNLYSEGHTVVVSDPICLEGKMFDKLRKASEARSNIDAVDGADAVIISVPVEKTAEVIREVSPHMRDRAILCEISSIKGKTPDILKNCLVNGVQPLCIHPMFGPGSRTPVQKILLLPILDAADEQDAVMTLFPNAEIILTTQEEHDRAMALTISLPYLVNMVLASLYIEEDLVHLQRMGGTTFTMQLLLMSSVMSNDSHLHQTLHSTNEYSRGFLRKFESIFQNSLAAISRNQNEFVESYETLQGRLRDIIDLNQKYQKMYQFLETMKHLSTEEAKL